MSNATSHFSPDSVQAREEEQRNREHFESALDKFNRSLVPGRRRPCALTFDEMRAVRQFVRKYYNS